MEVDRVCIIRRLNGSQCQNQDVLFVGTGKIRVNMILNCIVVKLPLDNGTILKVIFERTGSTIEPIVLEEILVRVLIDFILVGLEMSSTAMTRLAFSMHTQVKRLTLRIVHCWVTL